MLVARTTNVVERLARVDRLGECFIFFQRVFQSSVFKIITYAVFFIAVVFSSVLLRAEANATVLDTLPPASIPRRRKAFVLYLLSDLNETLGLVAQASQVVKPTNGATVVPDPLS